MTRMLGTLVPAVLISATGLVAQIGIVTGRVTDAATGQPIAAVQVFISTLDLGGLTQQNGRYLLQNVPAGTHTLSVLRIGYRTVAAQITVGGGRTVEQNFTISQAGQTESQEISPEARTLAVIQAGPVFTPMTVRPEIQNPSEIREALIREYPAALQDDGIGGTAGLWFYISDVGRVLHSQIYETSGHQQLDQAALEVASAYQFTPAMNPRQVRNPVPFSHPVIRIREMPVAVWIQIPIMFVPEA